MVCLVHTPEGVEVSASIGVAYTLAFPGALEWGAASPGCGFVFIRLLVTSGVFVVPVFVIVLVCFH